MSRPSGEGPYTSIAPPGIEVRSRDRGEISGGCRHGSGTRRRSMCNRIATVSVSDRDTRIVPSQSGAAGTTPGFASELAAETSRGDRRDTGMWNPSLAGCDAVGDRSPPRIAVSRR